ncbi:hypothetical protein ACVJ19_003935 [Bradyrhizobium sp. USDA 376]
MAARAARVVAVVPPAPTTFSMMMLWPSVCAMCPVTMREITSVGPPAANGTIIVMLRVG